MKKAHEKLGKVMADDEPLNKAFKDCVDNSLTGILLHTQTTLNTNELTCMWSPVTM